MMQASAFSPSPGPCDVLSPTPVYSCHEHVEGPMPNTAKFDSAIKATSHEPLMMSSDHLPAVAKKLKATLTDDEDDTPAAPENLSLASSHNDEDEAE